MPTINIAHKDTTINIAHKDTGLVTRTNFWGGLGAVITPVDIPSPEVDLHLPLFDRLRSSKRFNGEFGKWELHLFKL